MACQHDIQKRNNKMAVKRSQPRLQQTKRKAEAIVTMSTAIEEQAAATALGSNDRSVWITDHLQTSGLPHIHVSQRHDLEAYYKCHGLRINRRLEVPLLLVFIQPTHGTFQKVVVFRASKCLLLLPRAD